MLQFLSPSFGDCRDTYYPTSDAICLGENDVVVAIGVNHTTNNKSVYNNINIYDVSTMTSMGSVSNRSAGGDADSAYTVMAASKTDRRCAPPPPLATFGTIFVPVGSHSDLYSPPLSPMCVMERRYLNPLVTIGDKEINMNNYDMDDSKSRSELSQMDPTWFQSLYMTSCPPASTPNFRVVVFSSCETIPPTQKTNASDDFDNDGNAKFTCGGGDDIKDGVDLANERAAMRDNASLVVCGSSRNDKVAVGQSLAIVETALAVSTVAASIGLVACMGTGQPRTSSFCLASVAGATAVSAYMVNSRKLEIDEMTAFDVKQLTRQNAM
jgi:hypothetical protein